LAKPIYTERRLVAIFAADVEGYSRLMEADEVGTMRDLTHRRGVLDSLIASHHGRIANTAGDSVLAEFGSAVDAVQCAVEAQSALTDANTGLSPDRHINFRIGVHVGDVMIKGGDLFGDGVNIAARLQTLANASGVCVSGAAHDQVRKILPFAFTDLGAQHVKNIEEPVRAFAVSAKGASAVVALPSNASISLALPDKPSIAVLPFQNMSGDPEQEYFADGMVEDIITALSRFKSLFVIARNSSFTYKGKAVDIKQVGRELGVRYVLEGSVRKAANHVRITAQLVDAASGSHLWADRFDGALEDIFDLQDRVTASVVGAIAPKLERAEIERANRKPTESLDAYDYYLRGMASFHKATMEANAAALRLFYRAIELDPDFASAHGMAAWCYAWRKMNGWETDRVQANAETARLARRAAALGTDDAVALCAGGFALGYISGDLDDGGAMTDQALVLNPNLATAWLLSGYLKALLGEHEVAIEHLTRAMRLSPLDPEVFVAQQGLAAAHLFVGRYDEASSWAEKASRQRPNAAGAARVAAASHALAGRLEQAQKSMARLRQIDPALRISNLRDVLTLRRPEVMARYVEGLRKAGLPEE
jgi:TolB-like protein/class 3 adenylate cyclase/tetratricopeptide (TPR) repeat protein